MNGEKIGELTLVNKVSTSGKQRWACKCECGVIKEFRLDDLRSRVKQGIHPSCGCLFSEMRSEISLKSFQLSDYMLKRFGQLLVTAYTVVETKKGKENRLVCLCDCGAQIVVRADQITRGVTKSCGCLQKEHAKALGDSMLRHGQTVYGNLSGGITPIYQVWSTVRKCVKMGWRRGAHRVCHEYDPRWDDFENFLKDFGKIKASEGISRINNQLPWSKENCFIHVVAKRKTVGASIPVAIETNP